MSTEEHLRLVVGCSTLEQWKNGGGIIENARGRMSREGIEGGAEREAFGWEGGERFDTKRCLDKLRVQHRHRQNH